MRTYFFLLIYLTGVIQLSFASTPSQCNKTQKHCGQCCCNPTDSTFKSNQNDFSAVDSLGLMLMREEEKMAHDIYVTFRDKYDLRVFSNISQSETMHMNAVLSLINHYELNDPMLAESGKFKNKEIQDLFNKLIVQGADIIGALKAGAIVEEYDILDLMKYIDSTKNEDIKKVYSNLLYASHRHLNAFIRNLAANNINYKPQILSNEEFNKIITN